MFKTQNFCHIASNNRNQVKVGVFVYRTTDSLATVSASGYFNERIIDLKLHDIIIHEQIDASDATKVKQNFLCVVERTLTNVVVKIMDTDEVDGANTDLSNLTSTGKANISALGTYDSSATYGSGTVGAAIKANETGLAAKLNLDGSNIMTGPLKMRASASFQCAIAPYWDGIGFYKLNDNDSVTLMASMEDTTGFVPAGNATYDIGSSDHKWKDLYVSRVITGVLNNGANINIPTTSGTLGLNDFSNITDSAKNISNWSSNVTNCITEIPQDIKLELASGTLTLSAGSVLTRPDGTQATTTEDKTYTASGSSTYQGLVFVEQTSGAIQSVTNLSKISSGTSLPATPNANDVFYKTDTGVIYTYYNSQWNVWSVAMPIAFCTVTSGVITSIDQTFNGFGWLGTKVFVLPGVKALAPNGRNADGSLKSTVVTVSELKTTDSYNSVFILNNSGIAAARYTNYAEQETQPSFTNGSWYQPSTNIMYDISNGSLTKQTSSLYAFKVFAGSGVSAPTSMKVKQAFRAVDYSDTEFISNQAMPSAKSVNLTLGASGNTYTAPADGYYTVVKSATASNEYLYLRNSTSGLNIGIYPQNGLNGRAYIPVAKGDVITISYNLTGPTSEFKFIYANGAK